MLIFQAIDLPLLLVQQEPLAIWIWIVITERGTWSRTTCRVTCKVSRKKEWKNCLIFRMCGWEGVGLYQQTTELPKTHKFRLRRGIHASTVGHSMLDIFLSHDSFCWKYLFQKKLNWSWCCDFGVPRQLLWPWPLPVSSAWSTASGWRFHLKWSRVVYFHLVTNYGTAEINQKNLIPYKFSSSYIVFA